MPPTETAAPPGKTLELLNPAEIIPRNVRQQVDAGMVDSIRRRGQESPVAVLRTPGGQLFLRFGDRRRLACIALGREVEAVVTAATDEEAADLIKSILDQLAENDDREPLTAADRAYAVQYLFELGADEETVEKETGYSRAEITAARKARKSETARTLAAQYPLDMTQLSVVTEFEGTPEIAERLAEVARDNPAQFTHAAQLARDEREEAAMLAARAAELTARGFKVSDKGLHYENMLSYWAGRDGKPLDPENHKDCPDGIVVLQAFGYGDSRRVSESWYCTDPQGNGHKKRQGHGQPEKDPGEAAAEWKLVRENNTAWRAATAVRQNWIHDVLLARKDLPDGADRFIARTIAAAENHMINALTTMGGGKHVSARQLLGGIEKDSYDQPSRAWVSPLVESLAGVSEQRAHMTTLALIVGACEDQAADTETWRRPSRASREYLSVLAGWGYGLSEIEQGVVDAGGNRTEQAAAAAGQEN